MAHFGGTLMRGLGGLLGGYNEGMDAERAQALKDEEMRLRREAEARQVAQDQQAQANWMANQKRQGTVDRASLRDEGWKTADQLQPMGNLSGGGMPVDLSAVFQAAAQKRMAQSEDIGGTQMAAPLETKYDRIERQAREARRETLAGRLEVAKENASARADASAARNSERTTLQMRAAQDDLTAARAAERTAEGTYNQFLRGRRTAPPIGPREQATTTSDSLAVVGDRDAARENTANATRVRNELFGVKSAALSGKEEITQDEAAALRAQGYSNAQINANYTVR